MHYHAPLVIVHLKQTMTSYDDALAEAYEKLQLDYKQLQS